MHTKLAAERGSGTASAKEDANSRDGTAQVFALGEHGSGGDARRNGAAEGVCRQCVKPCGAGCQEKLWRLPICERVRKIENVCCSKSRLWKRAP